MKNTDSKGHDSTSGFKDEHGFWMNQPEKALEEAVKVRKPLLIDFYGVWCPPCNQYNETVFPTNDFRKKARNFVLLKMDADDELSWNLKSHFRVGGYPTFIIVQAPNPGKRGKVEIKELQEVDRVVGYIPVGEFLLRLDQGYANRNQSFEERVQSQKETYLENLKKLILLRIEQKSFAEALQSVEEGARLQPGDDFFSVGRLFLLKHEKQVPENKIQIAVLKRAWENRKRGTAWTLITAADLLASGVDQLGKDAVEWTKNLIQELRSRIDDKTLNVEGVELSIADLDQMEIELAVAVKDKGWAQKARLQGIASYRKLLEHFGKKDLKGIHLELAYLLWKEGVEEPRSPHAPSFIAEAKKTYQDFISKFPTEMTFYYAAGNMYFELKDWAASRDMFEKALKFSYGDNRLRSMTGLIRVMKQQGELEDARKRGNALLAQEKDPSGFRIRTDRYVQDLKKILAELGDQKVPKKE